MKHNSIGERMKSYEIHDKLIRGIPTIMRLDGKSFHSYTRNFNRPFDDTLYNAMINGAMNILKHAQGCKCAYIQSDEVSILFTDWAYNDDGTINRNAEPWLDYRKDRMNSISASYMVEGFYLSLMYNNKSSKNFPLFDCRVHNYPLHEVCNYFIWRQKDWERNSLQMLARTYYSHKELENKKKNDIHELLYEKCINWADLDDRWKNGTFISKDEHKKWTVHSMCPIFVENRTIIENLLI